MVNSKPGDTRDDSSLLLAAGRGKQAAFATLFDRHVRAVFYQAFSVIGDADQAQDVVQDAFTTLWLKREHVRLVDESVLPWLMVTARNLALNARRKTQRGATLSLVDDLATDAATDPARAVEAAFVTEQIRTSIAGLSELDQALFTSCIDGDLSYEQAAANLGVSHGTVRNRLSRLKQRLRGDLSEATEES